MVFLWFSLVLFISQNIPKLRDRLITDAANRMLIFHVTIEKSYFLAIISRNICNRKKLSKFFLQN